MKKVFLVLAIVSFCLTGKAQGKITLEQARSICAQEMAAFTKAVSGAYQKGISYQQFQSVLCGTLKPSTEGIDQLRAAYNFLVQGASADVIVKSYAGKEIAASLNYLLNAHQKGIESDGSELFGGTTGMANSSFSKNAEGGCRWYQFWCLMQSIAIWLVLNWPAVADTVTILNFPAFLP